MHKALLFPSSSSQPGLKATLKVGTAYYQLAKAKHTVCTGFQMAKKGPLLIQRSRPSRDSQEPKTKQKINSSKGFFQQNPLFVLFLAKILDLENPETCYGYFFILFQKNAFGQKNFKFHAWVQKCHFAKIEKLPKWHF